MYQDDKRPEAVEGRPWLGKHAQVVWVGPRSEGNVIASESRNEIFQFCIMKSMKWQGLEELR